MKSRQVRNGKTYIYPITHVRLRTDLGVVQQAMAEAKKLGLTFPKFVLQLIEKHFNKQAMTTKKTT